MGLARHVGLAEGREHGQPVAPGVQIARQQPHLGLLAPDYQPGENKQDMQGIIFAQHGRPPSSLIASRNVCKLGLCAEMERAKSARFLGVISYSQRRTTCSAFLPSFASRSNACWALSKGRVWVISRSFTWLPLSRRKSRVTAPSRRRSHWAHSLRGTR